MTHQLRSLWRRADPRDGDREGDLREGDREGDLREGDFEREGEREGDGDRRVEPDDALDFKELERDSHEEPLLCVLLFLDLALLREPRLEPWLRAFAR